MTILHLSMLFFLEQPYKILYHSPHNAHQHYRYSWTTTTSPRTAWTRLCGTMTPMEHWESTRKLLVIRWLRLSWTATWQLLMPMITISIKLFSLVTGLTGYKLLFKTWSAILLWSTLITIESLLLPTTKTSSKSTIWWAKYFIPSPISSLLKIPLYSKIYKLKLENSQK